MITIEHLCETYLLRIDGLNPLYSVESARAAREILCSLMGQYPEHALALESFAGCVSLMRERADAAARGLA